MKPPTITVRNLQRRRRIDVLQLQHFAARALPLCLAAKCSGRGVLKTLPEISVAFVSDPKIAALHSEFMNVTGPTDVLTFDHGEIVISVDTAAENARAFSTSVQYELQLYIVHGLLHLRGFDDRRPRDRRAMERAQERILRAAAR